MRAVVQRIRDGSVAIDGRVAGEMQRGLLVYLGIGREDGEGDLDYLVDKICSLRVFPDEEGRMNRSLLEAGGGVLVVSQFTLYGDARGARRPSYSDAAPPEEARPLYERSLELFRSRGLDVASGEFGAMMDVAAVNDGPVTILLDSKKLF
ncbi:MAG: D-tyrosyl-tRNA(Tyr) deacylase [Spirochaetales bacterium]|nr:D-tyrosyl-tRNA(Tyr) deacylase [Spirochaetales bacterium]